MNTLEDLVRQTLADRARDVDRIDLTAPRDHTRRGHRWVAIATVAAVAAAILVAVVLIAPWRGAGDRNAVGAVPNPPAGRQWVSYHGITLTVPESWPVGSFHCTNPSTSSVIADDGVSLYCAMMPVWTLPAGATIVRLNTFVDQSAPGTDITVAGRPARRLADDRHDTRNYELPSTGVSVEIQSADPQADGGVLDGIEYTPVDHLGCSATQAVPTDTSSYHAAAITAGGLKSGVVCQYARIGSQTPWLAGSRTLEPSEVAQLHDIITATRSLAPSLADDGRVGYLVFRLAETGGPGLILHVRNDESGVVFDDLGRWAERTDKTLVLPVALTT